MAGCHHRGLIAYAIHIVGKITHFRLKVCFPRGFCTRPFHVVVDGGWTAWAEWDGCTSNIFGEETQSRQRSCTNPAPFLSGLPCSGSTEETRTCGCQCFNNQNLYSCILCQILLLGQGVVWKQKDHFGGYLNEEFILDFYGKQWFTLPNLI